MYAKLILFQRCLLFPPLSYPGHVDLSFEEPKARCLTLSQRRTYSSPFPSASRNFFPATILNQNEFRISWLTGLPDRLIVLTGQTSLRFFIRCRQSDQVDPRCILSPLIRSFPLSVAGRSQDLLFFPPFLTHFGPFLFQRTAGLFLFQGRGAVTWSKEIRCLFFDRSRAPPLGFVAVSLGLFHSPRTFRRIRSFLQKLGCRFLSDFGACGGAPGLFFSPEV